MESIAVSWTTAELAKVITLQDVEPVVAEVTTLGAWFAPALTYL